MTLQERLSTGRGKWTPEYPELGTGPVSYDDAISQEFFDDEREAIFKRWWLYVGRVERLRRPGTYFTRELPGLASIVVARDLDGTIHAFHNVCAHRGNKVVWQEFPSEETSGSCRAFHCKYHGWQYGLDGKVDHVTNEEQFFDLAKRSWRCRTVRCEEVGGFIYINLDDDAEPLRDFLGERVCEIEQYPFHLMTQRYGFSTGSTATGRWPATRSRSGTTRRTCTRRSSTPMCGRPRSWCRRSTPTTTTCSASTSSTRCPARHRCGRARRARSAKRGGR